ncbi:MAG: hypothetical protein K2K58_02980, partial [Muribaculaceae bacterium]|nr:hypothetical protein [Muribaculaceae bacterium]
MAERYLTVHIFNPETDFALAIGDAHYSPPAKVLSFRREMALFPLSFAAKGDVILTLDNINPITTPLYHHFCQKAKNKGITIKTPREISQYLNKMRAAGCMPFILPWGWNHSLRRDLKHMGVEEDLLKTESEIDSIRLLSHRRTTISFNEILQSSLSAQDIPVAEEFCSTEKALEFCSMKGDVFLKAPWSSSGRGIMRTAGLNEKKIEEWVRGCINRQGSVMAEIAHDRTGDFATEWWIKDGEPYYMGLSSFSTTPDGRYKGNLYLSESKVSRRLSLLSPQWGPDIIEAQKEGLKKLIAPNYSGPVGIDMLTTSSGALVPCVEINLRMTMGMAVIMQRNINSYHYHT